MTEYSKDENLTRAAMRADMDRKTARKYMSEGKLPSQLREPRHWRTRTNPFVAVWSDIEERLEAAPELEAKVLFEDLQLRMPGEFDDGQLRTFQRRVKTWRATKGPPKHVFFAQEHRPGEAMQTDFTWATELGITIDNELFEHLLCHCVLPYSNWEWATVCLSESMVALRHGVQEAVFRLGKATHWHQTDNSTAATYTTADGERSFHDDYLALMRHLGMKPRTIAPSRSNQNGDVESLNGALKRRLEQHLLLRGDRDFESVLEYERWLHDVLMRANRPRQKKLQKELAAMQSVTVERLPTFHEEDVPVTSWSTVRVKRNTYSVPSRLIGERVRVRIYDDRLEIWYAQSLQLVLPRLRGEQSKRIDYRHVIWSLVRKPGAFERYKYRDAMFPTLIFRRAYDALIDCCGEDKRKADIEYLRILHLAASMSEREVDSALELLLETGRLHNAEDVRALVGNERPTIPQLAVPDVDLTPYDALLREVGR